MHGDKCGWGSKIPTIVNASLKNKIRQIDSLVSDHGGPRLEYQLHSAIRHAALHDHKMDPRLLRVRKKHGVTGHPVAAKASKIQTTPAHAKEPRRKGQINRE